MKRNLGTLAQGPFSEGVQTNPTTATVMADTGAITAGGVHSTSLAFEFVVTCWASVVATFSVQRRNAANDANVGNVATIRIPADMAGQYRFLYTLVSGERLRVVPQANITGTAAVTINGEQCV
jgi:hypothetical protein